MIKLLKPLNHVGGLVPVGTILPLGDKEAMLVESGAAEYFTPEVVVKKTSAVGPSELNVPSDPSVDPPGDLEEPVKEPEQAPAELKIPPELPLGRRGRK